MSKLGRNFTLTTCEVIVIVIFITSSIAWGMLKGMDSSENNIIMAMCNNECWSGRKVVRAISVIAPRFSLRYLETCTASLAPPSAPLLLGILPSVWLPGHLPLCKADAIHPSLYTEEAENVHLEICPSSRREIKLIRKACLKSLRPMRMRK